MEKNQQSEGQKKYVIQADPDSKTVDVVDKEKNMVVREFKPNDKKGMKKAESFVERMNKQAK